MEIITPSQTLKRCGDLLAKKRLTIATVESATAGRVAYEFSLLPQSGDILIGGIISYNAIVKETLLKLSPELIKRYTPESAEVTAMMAEAAKNIIKADIYIAVTGLTTPGGSETPSKPVGTIFANILMGDLSVPLTARFKGSPESIVSQSVNLIAIELIKLCS